ncbi:MAG: hypothetical protein H6606_05440 [Flavobacteriales bacterium]|nr:hypothetical protein [Flavobacteriales bacterium]
MKRRSTIEGTYQVNGNGEREFVVEFDDLPESEENNSKLFALLDHPRRLLKEGRKQGVHGVKRFFSVLFLFGITNTLLLFYSIIRLISLPFEFNKLLFVLLILIIGLGFTFISAYRTYQYVVLDTMRVIYGNLSSFFYRISELLIDKAENVFKGKADLTDSQITKVLDLGNLLNARFQRMPRFMREGITMILDRIPFVGMLMDLKEDVLNGNKSEASAKLYGKMDHFISNSIFGKNNTRWVWWLLPLNVLILLILIKVKIG